MNLIYEKTGVRYHEVHIYRLLHRWGLSPSSAEKVCQYSNKGGEKRFQKRVLDILSQIPQGFTVAIQDESIFIHDILVKRKLWLPKRIRPVVTTTGSHQKTCVFGTVTLDGNNSSLSMICLTRIHSLTIKKDNEKTGEKGNPVYRQGHSTRVKE